MIRQWGLSVILAVGTLCTATLAQADCALIDRLDKLYAIQSRLARDPDTALFATDIRLLRVIGSGIGNRAALEAVDGNGFTGHGADVLRFLQNTRSLLQMASLDDPQSVRPHFSVQVRENLSLIGAHLVGLRCNDAQIAIDAAIATERGAGGTSDAEDLADVAQTLNNLAKELFHPRTAIILLVLMSTSAIALPIIRQQMVLRQRRAQRHNITFATQYNLGTRKIGGMLIDINCLGAKLKHEIEHPLPMGQSIEIHICDAWVAGTVVWSNTHYSGVQFRKPIPLESVTAVCASEEGPTTQNGAPKDAA